MGRRHTKGRVVNSSNSGREARPAWSAPAGEVGSGSTGRAAHPTAGSGAHSSIPVASAGPDRDSRTGNASGIGILLVGDELVTGDVEDSNGPWIADALMRLGHDISLRLYARDDSDSLYDSLRFLLGRSGCVIVVGGLGPTADDITRRTVASVLGKPLVRSEQSVAHLRDVSKEWVDDAFVERTAVIPEGADPLLSPLGGASGFSIDGVVALPGNPREMRAIFRDQVARLLASRPGIASAPEIVSYVVACDEQRLLPLVDACNTRFQDVHLGCYLESRGGKGAWDSTRIVLRSKSIEALEEAARSLEDALRPLGIGWTLDESTHEQVGAVPIAGGRRTPGVLSG